MAPSGREDAASSAPTQSNSSVAPCSPSTRTTTSAKSDRFVCRSCNDVRISPSLRRTRVTGTSGPSCSSPGASNRRRLGARASISKRGAIDAPRPLLTRARGRYVRPGRHGVEDNALTGDACLCAPSRRLPLWSSTSVHSGQVPKPTRLPMPSSRGSTCTRDAAATHTPRAHAPLVYNCISHVAQCSCPAAAPPDSGHRAQLLPSNQYPRPPTRASAASPPRVAHRTSHVPARTAAHHYHLSVRAQPLRVSPRWRRARGHAPPA